MLKCRYGHVYHKPKTGRPRCTVCRKVYLDEKRAQQAESNALKRELKKLATKERQRQRARDYYYANKEQCLESAKKWREANPGYRARYKKTLQEVT